MAGDPVNVLNSGLPQHTAGDRHQLIQVLRGLLDQGMIKMNVRQPRIIQLLMHGRKVKAMLRRAAVVSATYTSVTNSRF